MISFVSLFVPDRHGANRFYLISLMRLLPRCGNLEDLEVNCRTPRQ